MALGIHKMNPHGRQIRVHAILHRWIIRSEETRTDHSPMERAKGKKPSRKSALHLHWALLSVRIRGSAQ